MITNITTKTDSIFWGSHYHDNYTTQQLSELNEHSVIISPYTVSLSEDSEVQQDFITEMQWWQSNCPNVSFLSAVLGIPGIFVWDGAIGTIDLAKLIVGLIQDNSLTNIVGLSFDWENPHGLNDSDIMPNITRHENAVKEWNDFFDWMDINAPDLFLSCVNYVSMGSDLVDDDFDLHYLKRYITYEVPRWDEYAPMIYRCGYSGTKPYGDPIVTNRDTTYDFYQLMKTHANTVEKVHGNNDKLGVYIGITNSTCYGGDTEVWEYGEYQGTGYDMLVRDAFIIKSFGAPIITVFILDTVIENGYSMGGVFESYGDDFLDNFNASINGENSTKSFQIQKGPNKLGDNLVVDKYEKEYNDILYNWNHWLYFGLYIISFSVATYFIIFYKKNES